MHSYNNHLGVKNTNKRDKGRTEKGGKRWEVEFLMC